MLRWEELKEKLPLNRLWKSSALEPVELKISDMLKHYVTPLWHAISYSNQTKLSDIFEKLQINPEQSYENGPMGACEIVSLIGMHAFFAKKTNIFKSLLSPYNFPEKYKAVMARLQHGESISDLTDEERMIAELIPFIEPAQLTRHYPVITDKEIMEAHIKNFKWIDRLNLRKRYFSNVNSFGAFQEEGGIITLGSWMGVYDKYDICKYLRMLSSALFMSDVDVVFQLSGEVINTKELDARGLHAVSLCYHAKSKKWSLIDLNFIDEADKTESDENVMADKVIGSFSAVNGNPVIETREICLGKDKRAVMEMVDDFNRNPRFIDMHAINDSVIKKSNTNRYNLLHRAAMSGFSEIINEINRNQSGGKSSYEPRLSPVVLAIMHDNYQCISPLISGCIDVNAPCGGTSSFKDRAPIHCAAQFNAAEVCYTLIELGADVNLISRDGLAPLHIAAITGSSKVIKPLVESGADVNLESGSGITSLHIAAMMGHSEVIKSLVEFGADVNKENNGTAPVHYAIMSGCLDTLQTLASVGADLHLVVKNTGSLLSLAVLYGQLDIVKFLLECDVDLEI